jgi:transcriptional regulator with XRE-family HTH domain
MGAINQRLSKAREVAYPGITMREVAERIGVSQGWLSRIENASNVGAHTLPTFADAYGCDCNWLVTGVGRKPRKAKVS